MFFVLLMVPVTAVGSYMTYTQARTRVAELNEITPLEQTDLEKAVRLALELDTVEDSQPASTPIPAFVEVRPSPSPVPTQHTETEVTDPVEVADVNHDAQPETAVETVATPSISDPRRVTVLLMGIDQRQGETGQFRSDTMIVLSLDPVGKTGVMLSIPRDLWVEIPGTNSKGRINTANFIGDDPTLNYPGGGPALAKLTVERLIGQKIDHYLLVNFDAFTTLIDVVGDVEICVQERIDDPKYPDGSYGFLPIVIEPGCQAMDATRLLQYSRTRATSGGDFDRATRQQETILAVRNQVLSTGGISALLGNALSLWESVSQNVKTDLTLDQLIELALIASDVNDIRNDTIGAEEVLQGKAPDDSDILIPIQTDIFALVADLFRPPTRPAAPQGQLVIPDPNNVPLTVREEAPIISVLNGTGIQGRAGDLQRYILSYNLDVGFVGNALEAPNVVNTYIAYYGDHAVSAEYLGYVLALINGNNIPEIRQGEGSKPSEGDVFVIVGQDLAIPAQ